ncbi:MAG: hypothetical protein ACKO5X_02330, partial [Limnohabitans sp.]
LNRVQFPVDIQKPQAFMQQHLKLCLLIGAILAVPLLITLYSLTFLSVLKSKTLLLFNLLAILEMVAGFWISGLMYLIWPEIGRSHAAWIGTTAYGLMFGVSIYHAQAFMKTALKNPQLHSYLHALACSWWVVMLGSVWLWSPYIRLVLLLGGSFLALQLMVISFWFYSLQPSLKRGVFMAVWVVYLVGMLVYWLFRYWEWPLVITLGTHFLQGALVTSLLGWSACMHVLQDRDALRLDMQLTKARSNWFAAAHHDLWQPLQSMLLYARALAFAPDSRRSGLLMGLQIASRAVEDFMGYLRFWAEGAQIHLPRQHDLRVLLVNDLLQPLIDEMRILAEQNHIFCVISHLAVGSR